MLIVIITCVCSGSTCPGVKIGAFRVSGGLLNPDDQDDSFHADEEALLRTAMTKFLPKASGKVLRAARCIFVMTPDNHFIIDTHPKHKQVGHAKCSLMYDYVLHIKQV